MSINTIIGIYIQMRCKYMNDLIEWIKEAVLLCSKAGCLNESELKTSFDIIEKKYMKFNHNEIDTLISILEKEFLPNDLVYIYSWFCTYFKESKFGKSLYAAIIKGEYDVWTSILLEIQMIVFEKNEWPSKYLLRKKNIESLCKKFNLKLPYRKYISRNKNEIIIVTEQLLGLLHAPTRIVCEAIRTLQEELGYKVTLVVCPTNKSIPIEIWGGKQYIVNSGGDCCEEIKINKIRYKDTEVIGYLTTMDGDCEEKYRQILEYIYASNPLFVWGMGVNNPIADLCKEFTTYVNMGMTSKCPVSMADILIRSNVQSEEEELEYSCMLQNYQRQIFLENSCPVTIDEIKNEYSKATYGLSEEDFVIAIVGNRLDQEIDLEFIEMLEMILDKNDNIHIAIIGQTDSINKYFDKEIFMDKIHYLGYCNELAGTYEAMDLYVNPKRTGGGWSGSIAIMSELPVVTLGNCDVAYNIGEEFVVANYDEMADEIVRCAADNEYYVEKKIKTIRKKEENSKKGMKVYVGEMLEKILRIIEEEKDDTV